MDIKFRKSMSTIKPAEIDETSSPNVTYIRKNIKEVTNDSADNTMSVDNTATYYEYDEAVLTKEEYQLYLQAQAQLQLRADVDYVILMGGY